MHSFPDNVLYWSVVSEYILPNPWCLHSLQNHKSGLPVHDAQWVANLQVLVPLVWLSCSASLSLQCLMLMNPSVESGYSKDRVWFECSHSSEGFLGNPSWNRMFVSLWNACVKFVCVYGLKIT